MAGVPATENIIFRLPEAVDYDGSLVNEALSLMGCRERTGVISSKEAVTVAGKEIVEEVSNRIGYDIAGQEQLPWAAQVGRNVKGRRGTDHQAWLTRHPSVHDNDGVDAL